MLPVPFIDYIPKALRERINSSGRAMCSKADAHISEFAADVIGLERMYRPDEVPASMLEALGEFISAPIEAFDDEDMRRKRIATSVRGHRYRGVWEFNVKSKIDIIAGGDSEMLSPGDQPDWIECGDGSEGSAYWACEGADGIDLNLGIDEIGDGTENVMSGVVFVDVDNSGLTADEIENIKTSLSDAVPAYFRIYLGYVSGTVFVKYPNGQIN